MKFYPTKAGNARSVQHKSKTLMLLERRKKVMELYKQRYTHAEIADLLGVERSLVTIDIRNMMTALEQDGIENAAIVRIRELMDLDCLERQAMKRLEKLAGSPHQGSRWAEIILSCKERRAKLLGLDAEQKFSVRTSVTVLSKEQKDAIFYAAIGGIMPVEVEGPNGEKLIEMKSVERPELIDKALDDSDARKADIPVPKTAEERAKEAIDAMYAPVPYSPFAGD